MKRKNLILSLIMATIVILAGLSSVVGSSDIEALVENKTVIIEINKYMGKKTEQILTEVSEEEAKEIEQLLFELYDAIERNDKVAISKYEDILNKRGIFGDEYYEFYSQDEFLEMVDTSKNSQLFNRLDKIQGDNISNYLCYFHAAGKGVMLFFIDTILLNILRESGGIIEFLILLFIFLPIFLFIMFLTHLIPFRILLPIGVISMGSGKMSSLGLSGFKSVTVEEPYDVNISFFTGLTVNIPIGGELHLFVSGVAFKVEESGYWD